MTLQIVLWAFAMASGAGWTWGFERHKATYNELLPDRRTRLAFPSVIWLGVFLYENVVWVQIAPGVRELIATNQQIDQKGKAIT